MLEVYDFVETSPISGPALMNIPHSVKTESLEPGVLQIPIQKAPFSLQYFNALRVSDV